MKAILIVVLLAIGLVGFIYGAAHHSRFIRAGGQTGFLIQDRKDMSIAASHAFNRMKRGYGFFCLSILIGLVITTIFGPVSL